MRRLVSYCRKVSQSSVHVGPHIGHVSARDTAALVSDLDGDVLFAFCNNDMNRRELLAVDTEALNSRSKGVLDDFEQNVVLFMSK